MRRFRNAGVGVLIGLTVVAMIAVAVLRARDAARTMLCQSNARMLAIVIHNYHNDFSRFPDASYPNPALPPEKRLSWQVRLFPYSVGGVMVIYEKDQPWDSEANLNIRFKVRHHDNATNSFYMVDDPDRSVRFLLCPSRIAGPDNIETHYVGIAGLGREAARLPKDDPGSGIFSYEDHQLTLEHVQKKDGTSNTMMVIETAHENGPWMAGGYPTVRGLDPDGPPYLGRVAQFSSYHYAGSWPFSSPRTIINAAFADASTRRLSSKIDPKVFEALATYTGGEVVTLPDDDF